MPGNDRPFRVRLAVPADVAVIARHRVGMLAAMGKLAEGTDLARRVEEGSAAYVRKAMQAGEWTAWIAEDEGGVLGSGSAIRRSLPPYASHPAGGIEVYLLNFFTEPAARRRGVAHAVVAACLAWSREVGAGRVSLHATADGRRVYEQHGFEPLDTAMIWRGPAPA